MPTLYIDVLFLLNFILNITILNAEAILLKIRTKPLRLIAGAVLGAVYACLVFIPGFAYLGCEAGKILLATLMTRVSFGTKRLRPLIRQTVGMVLITLCMGMFIMCLLYFTDIGLKFGGMIKKGVFYFDIPFGFMIPACLAATIIAILTQKALKNSVTGNCVDVTITYRGKTVALKALADTGNSLKDPLSGKKVIVTEEEMLSTLPGCFDMGKITEADYENLPEGFRFIPFSSVGEENGLLPAFVPDKICVNGKVQTDLIVAFFKGTLSQNGDYNALIGPCERKDVTNAQRKANYHNTKNS